ncbi:MAG: hypothetical protein ACLQVG_05740 [Terriglobia bacterium]
MRSFRVRQLAAAFHPASVLAESHMCVGLAAKGRPAEKRQQAIAL